ncbi:MAG: type II toxin-antitoxin system Phd/YefM family antitoxin [Chlamydiae bacterium]|nr:type II toxin-antitoxin system Phd/YefM family antitoxin [Chlamydiota bacterium]MBI3276562.1 type II toxin-antitoxin system Phd/YefM family antitoxin [Chlamydiota bacterium]
MEQAISISEARSRLLELPKAFARTKERRALALTRRGKPILALMSWDLYESIIETLDVVGDPEFMKGLRKSLKELDEGKMIPWETVKRNLKL